MGIDGRDWVSQVVGGHSDAIDRMAEMAPLQGFAARRRRHLVTHGLEVADQMAANEAGGAEDGEFRHGCLASSKCRARDPGPRRHSD